MPINTYLEQRYIAQWDEINTLTTMFSVGGYDTDTAVERFKEAVGDAYVEGFAAAELELDEEFEFFVTMYDDSINKEYNGISIEAKFREYYEAGDAEAIRVLTESEFHRSYGQGGMDAANQSKQTVYKTWQTMKDNRVRPTHDYLEGVKVPVGEKFRTYDGDEADYPGGFTLAENNANCRCVVSFTH